MTWSHRELQIIKVKVNTILLILVLILMANSNTEYLDASWVSAFTMSDSEFSLVKLYTCN